MLLCTQTGLKKASVVLKSKLKSLTCKTPRLNIDQVQSYHCMTIIGTAGEMQHFGNFSFKNVFHLFSLFCLEMVPYGPQLASELKAC